MNAISEITAEVPQVYGAISDVMAIMAKEGISKDKRNGQQGYNFRGIDDVYNTLCGVMAANRLIVLPFVQDSRREERQTKSGGSLTYTILTVDFTFVSAKDGSTCVARTEGEAMDSADKSTNKSMSAAMKYAALMVFMIPTEGDNDADATTHEVVPRQRREEPQPNTAPVISEAQRKDLIALATAKGIDARKLCDVAKIDAVKNLPAARFAKAKEWLNAQPVPEPGPATSELLDDEIPYLGLRK